ncbi:MAG TPA: xanthine dehydrogenase family protein molybdopterin-binding subunit [Candidatus Acidoferrum sp.]|nr:xanthine dehydrogenase family protein molybdopterin-binding subunit [Candidatus Acidoferrum sp.]
MNSEFKVVGKSVPRLDGLEKVTGEARYIDDVKLSNMAFGKILRSPHAHAKIISIDTSKAEKLPGVLAVITAKDTPMIKFCLYQWIAEHYKGRLPREDYRDKLPLENYKVRYVGDEVAAVAAVDMETAENALSLIKVKYERLPIVLDPEEAMKPGAPLIHDELLRPGIQDGLERNIGISFVYKYGEIEKGFKEADHVFEDTFHTSQQHHVCMETHGAIAAWDKTGRLTIWASTQTASPLRMEISKALDMPEHLIRVISVKCGGGFGSKNEMYPHEIIATILAKKTGRPVKIVYTREEDFVSSRTRHPMIVQLKTGVTKEGRITARYGKVIADKGAYLSQGPGPLFTAGWVMTSLYRVENALYEGYSVFTNKPYAGAFRGYGNPQMTFAIESQMDKIAETLHMDPRELRLLNARRQGDITASGCEVKSCGLSECIERVTDASGWKKKRQQKTPRHGIGMACLTHVSGQRGIYGDADLCGAFVIINDDGTVTVLTGGSDMGQGLTTVLAQIAAEEIGVKLEDVRMVMGDTDTCPMDFGEYASRGTLVAGNAVKAAAADAKKGLLQMASEMLNESPENLTISDRKISSIKDHNKSLPISKVAYYAYFEKGVSLLGRSVWDAPTNLLDLVTGHTKPPGPSPAYLFAAQVAEVEVDPETGYVKVLNFTCAHDVGKCINPAMVESQIDGALHQGIGYALTEGLMYNKNGRAVNATLGEYKMLSASDMPPLSRHIIVETIDPLGPYGAKGAGECALVPTAAAVANAIYDAVGVRITTLPITPEKVLRALKQKENSVPLKMTLK